MRFFGKKVVLKANKFPLAQAKAYSTVREVVSTTSSLLTVTVSLSGNPCPERILKLGPSVPNYLGTCAGHKIKY